MNDQTNMKGNKCGFVAAPWSVRYMVLLLILFCIMSVSYGVRAFNNGSASLMLLCAHLVYAVGLPACFIVGFLRRSNSVRIAYLAIVCAFLIYYVARDIISSEKQLSAIGVIGGCFGFACIFVLPLFFKTANEWFKKERIG